MHASMHQLTPARSCMHESMNPCTHSLTNSSVHPFMHACSGPDAEDGLFEVDADDHLLAAAGGTVNVHSESE